MTEESDYDIKNRLKAEFNFDFARHANGSNGSFKVRGNLIR